MSIEAYFNDIQKVILDSIQHARKSIFVAVAWFTDKELFDALCQKAQQGVFIHVILIDDEINNDTGKLHFNHLIKLKGNVTFLDTKKFKKMHHKFCVIDKRIVITGSYNWTNQAKSNYENINVIKNEKTIVIEYLNAFHRLTQFKTFKSIKKQKTKVAHYFFLSLCHFLNFFVAIFVFVLFFKFK